MSKLLSKANPDLRAQLLQLAAAVIGAIPDGASVEAEVSRGVDSFEEPGSGILRDRINGTITFKVLVDGGAHDRDVTHDELLAFALRLAEGDV